MLGVGRLVRFAWCSMLSWRLEVRSLVRDAGCWVLGVESLTDPVHGSCARGPGAWLVVHESWLSGSWPKQERGLAPALCHQVHTPSFAET